jgi:hypothetical protein
MLEVLFLGILLGAFHNALEVLFLEVLLETSHNPLEVLFPGILPTVSHSPIGAEILSIMLGAFPSILPTLPSQLSMEAPAVLHLFEEALSVQAAFLKVPHIFRGTALGNSQDQDVCK